MQKSACHRLWIQHHQAGNLGNVCSSLPGKDSAPSSFFLPLNLPQPLCLDSGCSPERSLLLCEYRRRARCHRRHAQAPGEEFKWRHSPNQLWARQQFPEGTGPFILASSLTRNFCEAPSVPLGTSKNLHITSYGPGTTESQIRDLFSTCCRVIKVMMKDKYCFVHTTSVSDADKVLDAMHLGCMSNTRACRPRSL